MVKPVPDVRMMKKVHLVQTTENIDLVKIEAANAHELAARGQAFEQMLKERAAADERRAGWFRRFAGVVVAAAAIGLFATGRTEAGRDLILVAGVFIGGLGFKAAFPKAE